MLNGGFPTEVSDMARNMKMELLTFSLILYQSKNCGHRILVLFMMYILDGSARTGNLGFLRMLNGLSGSLTHFYQLGALLLRKGVYVFVYVFVWV
jgi:hypothetical protein